MKKLSTKIAKKLTLSYFIAFIIGNVILISIIAFNNWNISSLLEKKSLLTLLLISGITMRFLSGVGLAITFAMISSFAFKTFSDQLKGEKKRAEQMKTFFVICAFILFAYGMFVGITALFFTRDLTSFEKFVSIIFGLWSLIILVYLLPTIKREYDPYYKEGTFDKVKHGFSGFKYSIWRGYKSKIRKDYGAVYAKEYDRYKMKIESLRDKLSGFLLFPFSFILLPIAPLMCLSFVLWVRIFSLSEKQFTKGEIMLLCGLLCTILVLGSILFMTAAVSQFIPYYTGAYALGLCISMMYLIRILLKS